MDLVSKNPKPQLVIGEEEKGFLHKINGEGRQILISQLHWHGEWINQV